MKILLISFFILGLLVAVWELIAKPLLTKKLFYGPRARPLDEETRKQCAVVVKSGRGYPYVCKTAVCLARCPCQPCPKVKGQESRQ